MSRRTTGKAKKARNGDVIAVPLLEVGFGYGLVAKDRKVAFFDYRSDTLAVGTDEFRTKSVAFTLWVMEYALDGRCWPVVGTLDELPELAVKPVYFFMQDAITKELTITEDGSIQRPATRSECEGLEVLAAWDPEHVRDRLADHFAGRPNKWVESLAFRTRE